MRDKVLEDMNLQNKPELIAKLDQIEKVADLVDRGMAPETAAEFGRTMDKASSFMKVEEDKHLARILEAKYFEVTKHNRYKGLSALEAGRMTQKLFVDEAFADAIATRGANWLSVRILAGGALNGAKKFASQFLRLVTSEGVTAALKVTDPLLLMGEPSNLGCSELGHHDWVQDPNCKPAYGLTPKVIEFLGEDWDSQKFALESEQHTCDVIKKAYQHSVQAPKISK
jgi:hypothetical protein